MDTAIVIVATFILTTVFEAIVFYIQHHKYENSVNKERMAFNVARKIDRLLLQTTGSKSTVQKIADFLPSELNFTTGVVVLYDKHKNVLRRVAASNTKEAAEAIQALKVPFSEIEIPISESRNLMSRALRERKEFTTTNLHDVFIPVLTQDESDQIQKIMSTKTTIVYPIYLQDTPFGVFIASSNKSMYNISQYEKDIISVFVDGAGIALQNSQLFSTLAETTDNLRNANAKLQQVDNLKDEFISIASHDLRTPLSVAKDYLYLAVKESALSSDLNRHLLTAQRATEQAITLVNDMLDVSRIEAGRIQITLTEFNISKLIQEVREELDLTLKDKKIEIEISANEGLTVKADIDRVRQIITNLISNAIKFTPEGGKISILAAVKNKTIEISITDTGVGIKPEDINKLFKKFGRLDNTRVGVAIAPGTGLGLYITKKLVELLGGKIWVESEYGHGTKFTFNLPSL